jgi:hypothetical protein
MPADSPRGAALASLAGSSSAVCNSLAFPYTLPTMIHENLSRAIAEFEARMTSIRDSL